MKPRTLGALAAVAMAASLAPVASASAADQPKKGVCALESLDGTTKAKGTAVVDVSNYPESVHVDVSVKGVEVADGEILNVFLEFGDFGDITITKGAGSTTIDLTGDSGGFVPTRVGVGETNDTYVVFGRCIY